MSELKTYTFKRTKSTSLDIKDVADGAKLYYDQVVDVEPFECTKLFHDLHHAEDRKYAFHFDWSPYSTPSENDLAMWFALGCPDRRSIGDDKSVGSLDSDRLVEAMGRNLQIEGY